MKDIDSRKKALICARACQDKKAKGIVLMEMKEVSNIADFFIICEGQSDKQLKAIADNILEKLKNLYIRVWHIAGYEEAKWILLDYNDVIIHIFCKQMRSFYDLEHLWSKAPRSSL
ncbi:MAG: ribosome silencing factor [Candidatus Omnitrophota bacterium]|nr:ribosome silencing factor [Candidatus Omnitrophota bacterium]